MFKSYTGNAFLNNALQTLEVLLVVDDFSVVTPEEILRLYQKPLKSYPSSLLELNLRLKSYSMIFTRNGPLHNDKEFGKKIYDKLINLILKNYEDNGSKVCELSGLRYEKSFQIFYQQALKEIGYPEKKIASKDTTINRCWFPLIGALGSDAQALPQAKFAINIHPICLVILQFLPLSAVLYRGGILLIDSTNFAFSKEYIRNFIEDVNKEISKTPQSSQIENIRNYKKGNFILLGLEWLAIKESEYGDFNDIYSDLNLWSFSNSGTGASCSIDRVPNVVFKKLQNIKKSSAGCSEELKSILNGESGGYFIDCLLAKNDCNILYPSKKHEGVSVEFFETYQREIDNSGKIPYSKYIAELLNNFKDKKENNLLSKRDAYSNPEYKTIIFRVLVEAATKHKWNIIHHINILDNTDQLPIQNNFYKILKHIHFYYQRKSYGKLSEEKVINNPILNAFLISLRLLTDIKQTDISDLKGSRNHEVSLNEPIIRAAQYGIPYQNVYAILYSYGTPKKYGLRDLLRIYYNYEVEVNIEPIINEENFLLHEKEEDYIKRMKIFSRTYFEYYLEKYSKDHKKFKKHILDNLRRPKEHFISWLIEACNNMKSFYLNKLRDSGSDAEMKYYEKKLSEVKNSDLYSEALLYDMSGNFNVSLCKFSIEYYLNQLYFLNQN
ncbi:hypothetical protein RCC89_16460 [Cytophagaceae bacterium ABcell3]|nr:hypothetical protein RCC89_16460 [Cytophagaceae bacterium ABcell3]